MAASRRSITLRSPERKLKEAAKHRRKSPGCSRYDFAIATRRLTMKTAMSWYHLGLRGRLFMAFGVVAALTVLASSSAIISYDSLGRSLGAIAEKSLPEITRASEVVRAAGEVAAAAPRLLVETDAADREQAFKVLTAARQELTQSIGSLDADDDARLNKTANRILVNLDRLVQSV